MTIDAQGPALDAESTSPGAGTRLPDTTAHDQDRTHPARTAPDTGWTGHAPDRTRRGGRGEAEHSPRRVQARRRAEVAAQLRADGATLQEIADHLDDDGRPLYTSRGRAHEAIKSVMQRGALAAFQELAGRVPRVLDSDEEIAALARTARPALAALVRAAGRGQVDALPEQRAALAGALVVVEALVRGES